MKKFNEISLKKEKGEKGEKYIMEENMQKNNYINLFI